jgi:hypothetical protein
MDYSNRASPKLLIKPASHSPPPIGKRTIATRRPKEEGMATTATETSVNTGVSTVTFVARTPTSPVRQYSNYYYGVCSDCEYLSAPQRTETYALFRLDEHIRIIHAERIHAEQPS